MEPFARTLVRWRWVVLVVWTVIGAVAAVRAPATPARLNTRGGSSRETEASRTEKLLNERFARPIGEFFAVTLEGPSRFDSGPSRAVLDSVLAALEREPYVRGLVSYPGTRDTSFLSHDRRSTFVLVAIDLEKRRQRQRLRPADQGERAPSARGGARGRPYRARVTGRAPFDLDIRAVAAEDSQRGERALLPLTLASSCSPSAPWWPRRCRW